jgi:hypothetical protein
MFIFCFLKFTYEIYEEEVPLYTFRKQSESFLAVVLFGSCGKRGKEGTVIARWRGLEPNKTTASKA